MGITYDASKTKFICIGGNETDLILNNNKKIENCDHNSYIGVDINIIIGEVRDS